MVEILFTRRALKDIRKLSPQARKTVERGIAKLFENVRVGEKLYGDWKGYWKLTAGDYRIIYKIKSANLVEVQYVRHRREPYR